MAKSVTHILEEHDIPYMITFGTLLGAVRHKGFIPWDDDFDIFLFDDSYEKALEVLGNGLPASLFLENELSEPLYFHGFSHVKDAHTIALCKQYPQDNLYSHKGLSIDLYKAVRMRDCDLNQFLLKETLSYYERRHKVGSMSLQEFEQRSMSVKTKLDNLQEEQYRRDIFGMALPERFMEIDSVLPLKKYPFADTFFFGPSDPDKLLRSFYGDYMKLPPVENRVPHYDVVSLID